MNTKPTETFVPVPKGTMENIKIMAFVSQLDRLYKVNKRNGKIEYVAGLCGPYFMFHSLYDFLTEKGFNIEFQVADGSTEEYVKKHLWEIAKTSAAIYVLQNGKTLEFKKEYQIKQNGKTLEFKKEYQIKLYKSELLYLCLVQLFNLNGKELSFDNEDGSKRQVIRNVADKELEENTIRYLEIKAGKLI